MRTPLFALALILAGCSEDSIPLPAAPVELVVDGMGITHVYGKSDRDALFGAGYAMARDRLFQMEIMRRRALGTAAEIVGTDALPDDIGARTFNFRKLGEQDVQRMRAEHSDVAALVQAWIAGVNQRIDEVRRGAAPRPYGLGPGELDFVPAPWTPEQVAAIGKALAFQLSNSLDSEVLATAFRRLEPDAFARLPILMPTFDTFTMSAAPPHARFQPPAGPLAPARPIPQFEFRPLGLANGSNNWAVDGAHTDNGRPLLCGDPHQPLTSPSRFYPIHISSSAGGGTLDVIGFAVVGAPLVALGHNAHIGWTATTNFADVMDIWDVKVDSTFAHARLGKDLVGVVKRVETFHALGNPDVQVTIHEIPGYGVFLPEEGLPIPLAFVADGQLLVNWTGFRPTVEGAGLLALDRARNLDEFEHAVKLLQVGAQNLIAADASGIDYSVHAAVPDRGPPAARPMPWHSLPGDDAASFWTRGDLPDAMMPHWRAPERGFLVTANNDPWGFTADGNVENDPFYYGAFYDKGFRAHTIEARLSAMLADGGRVSRADMEALQSDVHSTMADELVPRITAAVAAIGSDPTLSSFVARKDELAALAERLAAWDHRFARDESEPVLLAGTEWFAARRAFEQMVTPTLFDAIAHKAPSYLLGALLNLLGGRYGDPAAFIPQGEHQLLVASLADTADWLRARFGSLDPGAFAWKDVHAARFRSECDAVLDGGDVAVDGHADTIDVSEAYFFRDGMPANKFVASVGPLERMVIGFDEDGTPAATVDFARGSRGDPADPHFADQQSSWVEGNHAPLLFRRADVDAAATERMTLPAGR